MKIAMIGQKGIPSRFGGIETHVTELSTRLVRYGHDVTAYSRTWYSDKKMKRFNGIALQFVPTIRSKHLDAITHTLFSTLHACFILRPDVIHYHGVGPSLLAWVARLFRPQAVVISTFHCIDRHHAKWGPLARLALRLGEKASVKFAHATIAVSKTLRNYASLNYDKPVQYIPNGITPVRMPVNETVLRGFGLQPFQYIAMVSRLVPHKGAHTLIEAWKKVNKEKPELFAGKKLAIVGGSAFTDAYVKRLHAMASGDDSIVFTGYQTGDALKALFAGASFVAHPSTSEGLPIAILEAMSYGKAVVASDIAENMEVISEYGVPFPANDVDALKTKLIELTKDPMQAASIGHQARTFVEQNYHWDDIAGETSELYNEYVALRDGVLAI
jgi:glycosyltransferase involved in cell wall biosynthesis